MAEPDDFGVRDRPHVSISAFREAAAYAVPRRPRDRKPLRADYAAHAAALLDQLTTALGNLPAPEADPRLRVEGLKQGVLVEVSTLSPDGDAGTQVMKVPAALEFPAQDIVLLRSERNEDRTESAILFVPDDARSYLSGRIEEYGRDPGDGRRTDEGRFEVLETVRPADVGSLFSGDIDLGSPEILWWELWIRGAGERPDRVAALARESNLDVHADRLYFPDTTVVFVHAAAEGMASFAARVPGAITEIRRATGTIEPFLERGVGTVAQHDWVAEFAGRVIPPPAGAPVVCTLDTGVSAEHPLLTPGLLGAWSYDAAWGTGDHAPEGGHGTPLAGLVLYGDLEPLMNGALPVELTHGAESMKLVPPPGFPITQPPSYGVVTQGAVALAEVERPGVQRSFCLAASASAHPPSRPSTWSGALDQIAAGAMAGEAKDGAPATDAPKRLVLERFVYQSRVPDWRLVGYHAVGAG